MKKIFTMAALSMAIAFGAAAQDTKVQTQAPTSHHKEAKDFAQALNLTPDQQAQWKSLAKEYKPKYMAIKSDSTLSKEQRKAQFKALHEEQKTKLNTILTPEQQTKLAELKKQKVAKFKQQVKQLDLTAEQKSQWKAINNEYKTKMINLKNDPSYDEQSLKAAYKNLAKERMDKVRAILNDDQKAKLAEFKKDRHHRQFNRDKVRISDNAEQSNG